MSVFKIVSGNAVHYIRAVNAANARIRAYKALGLQHAQVSSMGHYAPNVGATGYDTACRTVDAYKAPTQAPKALAPMPRATASNVNAKALALAQFLGLAQ